MAKGIALTANSPWTIIHQPSAISHEPSAMSHKPSAMTIAAALLLTGGALAAQDVQTDPIQCWWRTSAGAVRVGEGFSVVLTCAIVETDAATVVVDRSRLEASVVPLAPSDGARVRPADRGL